MRNDHDTELTLVPTFSTAVTRELDDGVPILPADDTVTQKIVRVPRITDQDLLNEFETDVKTVVPTGNESGSDDEDWQNTFGDA